MHVEAVEAVVNILRRHAGSSDDSHPGKPELRHLPAELLPRPRPSVADRHGGFFSLSDGSLDVASSPVADRTDRWLLSRLEHGVVDWGVPSGFASVMALGALEMRRRSVSRGGPHIIRQGRHRATSGAHALR